MRDGLSVRLMAVLCPFRRPSMCRHVHRQLLRNELPNFTTIVPVTVYHYGSYVETYSRYMEAAQFAIRYNPRVQRFYQRKQAKAHCMVARKAVAHKLARACFYIMRDLVPFDADKAFG